MAAKKSSNTNKTSSDIFEVTIEKGVITPAISTSVLNQVSEHLDKKLLFNCQEDLEPDASFIQLLFILRSERVEYAFNRKFSNEVRTLLTQTGLIEALPSE